MLVPFSMPDPGGEPRKRIREAEGLEIAKSAGAARGDSDDTTALAHHPALEVVSHGWTSVSSSKPKLGRAAGEENHPGSLAHPNTLANNCQRFADLPARVASKAEVENREVREKTIRIGIPESKLNPASPVDH